MLRLVPVKKLSRQMMSWPASIKRSHKWEPRNPAPPVIRMDLRSSVRVCGMGAYGERVRWAEVGRAAGELRTATALWVKQVTQIRDKRDPGRSASSVSERRCASL